MNKEILYVVVGKGFPRSVGFRNKKSALSYAYYFKEKGKKPRIIKQTEEYLKLRFKKRFHNTISYHKKHKKR